METNVCPILASTLTLVTKGNLLFCGQFVLVFISFVCLYVCLPASMSIAVLWTVCPFFVVEPYITFSFPLDH